MASHRSSAAGSAVWRLAFIGKPVRGRFTVSFHSGISLNCTAYNFVMASLAQLSAMPANVHEQVLDNGLRVLIQEVHTAPLATVWCWYRVGSKDEGLGLTGVSHWVEHMNFKGTRNIPREQVKGLVERY